MEKKPGMFIFLYNYLNTQPIKLQITSLHLIASTSVLMATGKIITLLLFTIILSSHYTLLYTLLYTAVLYIMLYYISLTLYYTIYITALHYTTSCYKMYVCIWICYTVYCRMYFCLTATLRLCAAVTPDFPLWGSVKVDLKPTVVSALCNVYGSMSCWNVDFSLTFRLHVTAHFFIK